MSHKLTAAQSKAVEWIKQRGRQGVIDKDGHMLAMGEVTGGIAPVTWLRLVGHGVLMSDGHGRFFLKGEVI
nr:hypothetical protein [uncultured Dongia sp.]